MNDTITTTELACQQNPCPWQLNKLLIRPCGELVPHGLVGWCSVSSLSEKDQVTQPSMSFSVRIVLFTHMRPSQIQVSKSPSFTYRDYSSAVNIIIFLFWHMAPQCDIQYRKKPIIPPMRQRFQFLTDKSADRPECNITTVTFIIRTATEIMESLKYYLLVDKSYFGTCRKLPTVIMPIIIYWYSIS